MMELVYILLFLVSLGGVYLLWRNGQSVSREKHQLLEQEKQQVCLELARLQQKESILEKDLSDVKVQLDGERRERMTVERTLESTNAYLQAQQEKLQEQKQEIIAVRSQFNRDFQLMANQILEEKSQKFTQINQEHLGLILDPLKDRIKEFETKVEQSYHQEAAERNVLKGVVEQLMQQSLQIKDEANNLTKALKGDTKKQGNWGEVILERVLERSGLTKDQEYRLQVSIVNDNNTRSQPDAIIALPDNKHVVIDAKVSLLAYERYVNADTEDERKIYLKQHVQSVENHVKELSGKNYHSLQGLHSPDFVLLFLPIESALSASVMSKPELFSDAWERKVVIVSPSTLLATLRTIAAIWKQERQNRNVLEIAREAGLLYDKFVGFLSDMQQIQTHIQRASERHDEAMKKLTSGPGNVTRKIERLKELGAKANKQIDDDYLEK